MKKMINKNRRILGMLFLIMLFSASLFADDNEGNKSFIKWLMEESGENKSAQSPESSKESSEGGSFDYFRDNNDNGIDDRVEDSQKAKKTTISKDENTRGRSFIEQIGEAIKEDVKSTRSDTPAFSSSPKKSSRSKPADNSTKEKPNTSSKNDTKKQSRRVK